MESPATTEATGMLDRLLDAVNRHDLEALAGCFGGDFRNETPVHPARSFEGRAQVRKNWEQIFGGVPDLTARVVRRAVDGDTVWSEWEMQGTRRDGSAHAMRGVVIFGLAGAEAAWARFYLEPLDTAETNVDSFVRQQVRATGAAPQ